MRKYLVIGAGFSGSVLARELVQSLDARVTVLDSRSHIAGNCHTERDATTGVMMHVYGPHIFNTDNERVWRYVNEFVEFVSFANRVKVSTPKGIFSFPINLHTINQFFGTKLNPQDAVAFIRFKADRSIREPANFEEQALKMIGHELYEEFFYGYTKKQWGCEPRELPASILKRLPIRFDYNDLYYSKKYQAIPREGYTAVVERILDHPRISVRLDSEFVYDSGGTEYDHVFFTGAIDAFFDYCFGRLGYRTITLERIDAVGDFQGNAVINYPTDEVPWTRIHEHKHFAPWETHEKTVAFREFSKETSPADVPYYPKRLSPDIDLLEKYKTLAKTLSGVSFLGRLGTYRYLDMEKVIDEALAFAGIFIESVKSGSRPPVLSNLD